MWWIPLAFAVVVGSVGTLAYRALSESMRSGIREQLRTVLDADVAALELWLANQQSVARLAALDPRVVRASAELLALDRATPPEARRETLLRSQPRRELEAVLDPILAANRFAAWGVYLEDDTILAASLEDLVGVRLNIDRRRSERVFAGGTTIAPPTLDDVTGEPQSLLRLAAPVPGPDGGVQAGLGFVIPAGEFSEVLRIARAGESGETYAFGEHGAMLSHSRFEAQLVELGLLEPGQESVLRIEIRDPGGDLTRGFVPDTPLRGRPLTRMAASAISDGDGFDVDGYADYRGVTVVGAWTWLDELGIGVTTEIDHAEAYSGLASVRLAFGGLFGLLLLAALGMLAYSVVIARLERRYETARRLGRYRVLEKIGEGGMGKVYRAQHALLRRPTAVKLLDSASAGEQGAKRFEREVQAAASLTHPNTIAIYDYGTTPDGSFYYAMEYLEGVDLGRLVTADGAQPQARVLHILRQAAGAIAEAHLRDFVHRDLKPSNIMLSNRGGLFDFVKVLDFGLVRGGSEDELQLTQDRSLTGTPLYLAPEALEAPDAVGPHSDVYQLGAIAYFLLTGRHVFTGETLVELLSAVLHTAPRSPAAVLGRAESDLDRIVLACLEKDPKQRPTDASALLAALDHCEVEGLWTQVEARLWWEEAGDRIAPSGSDAGTGSLPSGWQVDLAGRARSV